MRIYEEIYELVDELVDKTGTKEDCLKILQKIKDYVDSKITAVEDIDWGTYPID